MTKVLRVVFSLHDSYVSDEVSEDELRGKKSELRLYCDLLMQQVHSIREAVKNKTSPDLQVCWVRKNRLSSYLGQVKMGKGDK